MNYEKANKAKDTAVEWVQTNEGAKAFADAVVSSAFVKFGVYDDSVGGAEEEASEALKNCGKMLAMVHPQAVFHACCEHAHSGTGACLMAMKEEGRIEGAPDSADALQALMLACDLMSRVVEKTQYFNYKNICKGLNDLPEALDKVRIHDEAFGIDNDGVWIGFDPMDGTVTVRDGDKNE